MSNNHLKEIKEWLSKDAQLIATDYPACPGYMGIPLEKFDRDDLINIINILYKKEQRLERIIKNLPCP